MRRGCWPPEREDAAEASPRCFPPNTTTTPPTLTYPCIRRSEARAGSRPYAAAYLLAPREEVAEGLLAHWNCPQALREWFRREGGLGTTAGQFL